MRDLGTVVGGTSSVGAAINNAGQVTGTADLAFQGFFPIHIFLYSNGQMTDLGSLLLGQSFNDAEGINDKGQIVGRSFNRGQFLPFLYSNGQFIDVNNLIDPTLGIRLFDASGINNNGQIIAAGGSSAYLLTPVPEPSTFALFSMALLGLSVWPRRFNKYQPRLLNPSHASVDEFGGCEARAGHPWSQP